MRRRDFLKGTAASGLALGLPALSLGGEEVNAWIDVLLEEPLGTISPDIYGHFTEHLGGVIYGGVWVGPNSKIPNDGGVRAALVEALRKIKASVIRWPGGCFADSYDWKDGVGPRDRRPKRTNFWVDSGETHGAGVTGTPYFEDNAFGTDEFLHFCGLSGAQPYLAANLRSLPALDFDRWVEYCNSPAGSTSMADLRAAGGHRDPFNVRYWGVGNESWGCGGSFTPEEYASEFRRFTTWIPSYGLPLQLIGSGPSDNDLDWTHRFFAQIFGSRPYHDPNFTGWSVHHYSMGVGSRDALVFGEEEWYGLFQQGYLLEKIIVDQWAAMGQYDRDHSIRMVVDEYGPWHKGGSELAPTHLFEQQITMRDALLTAFSLDIFNRHPEKIMMANCAQLINNLNALFLAVEDRFLATPNYDVFEMYAAHQGGKAVRAIFAGPEIAYRLAGKPAQFWGLNGSASLSGKKLILTVVNPDMHAARTTRISLRGGTARSGSVTTLRADDVHAHNTFQDPNAVRSKTAPLPSTGSALQFVFPAASVAKLEFDLG